MKRLNIAWNSENISDSGTLKRFPKVAWQHARLLWKNSNQGFDVSLSDASSVFDSIKSLSQSDGRWRYDSSSAESSTYVTGTTLETLAGVVSLVDPEVDQSRFFSVIINNFPPSSSTLHRILRSSKFLGIGQLFSDLGLASSVLIDPVSISSGHQSRLGCLAALCLGYETS
ncbi:uncharacterized protein A4U43_C10F5260 [Asparagus officinalis]|uniref:Uncharacterized protein n=1 Tax=Asparagus officinalis TaxID=4686 RepID=A0A5P1E0U2_ASPOF|nr:uncharacterized protein A4U43_C10F5260 [Asparagus officinalis]